jgi:hypothetical protein
MKYSIATDKWTTIKDLGIGGNRLDFNVKDGLLYSESSKIYTINPTTGALSTTRPLMELKRSGRRSSFR